MGTCSCPQQELACGWRDQPFSVSAFGKGCYFSCHVCWGPAQVCFSCRKAGSPIWNTHNSHVIDDDLAQRLALAPWQLKGTGWASLSSQHWGTRKRRENARFLSVQALQASPFFSPAHSSLKGLLASAHTTACWRGPAVQWPPPLSVHLFLLTECVRKHPTLRRGKSESAEIHAAALWRAKAGRGRKSIFHFGKSWGYLRKAWCFSTQTWVVLGVTIYKFSLPLSFRIFHGMMCS